MHVLTVFRLADAALKGAFELLAAIDRLRDIGVDAKVTFAGTGPVPVALQNAVEERAPAARVVVSPDEKGLAALYEESHILVLATRLQTRPVPYGEGFGIVLAEAALAGRLVVAPAFGGSADAFIPGVTGLRPTGESAEALFDVLQWCAQHPEEVQRLASNARVWARAQFHPMGYQHKVAQVVFGERFSHDGRLAVVDDADGGLARPAGPR